MSKLDSYRTVLEQQAAMSQQVRSTGANLVGHFVDYYGTKVQILYAHDDKVLIVDSNQMRDWVPLSDVKEMESVWNTTDTK